MIRHTRLPAILAAFTSVGEEMLAALYAVAVNHEQQRRAA